MLETGNTDSSKLFARYPVNRVQSKPQEACGRLYCGFPCIGVMGCRQSALAGEKRRAHKKFSKASKIDRSATIHSSMANAIIL